MKLISMTDFILNKETWYDKPSPDYPYKSDLQNYYQVVSYAKFLKQKLELWMFIPCDKDCNLLEEPDFLSGDYDDNGFGDVDKYQYKKDMKIYHESKERVLFKGDWVLCRSNEFRNMMWLEDKSDSYKDIEWNSNDYTIEDLVGYGFRLTESALKQIK